MDVLLTLLLALPTIFLAAFFAAMLENFRERRRTRQWVMRNLLAFADNANTGSVAGTEAAIQRWLTAETAADMDEDAWRRAWSWSYGNAPDFTPLLRSEAATAVPAPVFTAVRNLEDEVTSVTALGSLINQLFDRDVAPLWYERRVPLAGADRRRVAQLGELLTRMRTQLEKAETALAAFREAVRGTRRPPLPPPPGRS